MRHFFAAALITIAAVAPCAVAADAEATDNADNAVIAIVQSREITAAERDKLPQLIAKPLLEEYAREQKLEPTAEELDTFILKMEEKQKQHHAASLVSRGKLVEELKSPALSEKERERKEAELRVLEQLLKSTREMEAKTKENEEAMRLMKRPMAQHFVQVWKINKSLYQKYGGRVIFQQAGVEPVDAYRDFLREQEKKGTFEILDQKAQAEFWRYYTDDKMHTFLPKEEGEKFINTPWWLMEETAKK